MADEPSLPEGRDVDDVLSSIRRLVSSETEARLTESHRAYVRRTSSKADAADALRPTGDSKPLLLSPSLRVDDADASENATKQEGTDAPGANAGLLRLVPENRVDGVQVAGAEAGSAAEEQAVSEEPVPAGSGEDLTDLALRELVRSVLREELEGEIGDRISRNITQFVRKEIARALADRDQS